MQEENIRSESDTNSQPETPSAGAAPAQPRRRRGAGRDAGPPASAEGADEQPGDTATTSGQAEPGTAKKTPAKKSTATSGTAEKAPAKKAAAQKTTAKKATAKKTTAKKSSATKTSAATESEPARDPSNETAASETDAPESLTLVDPVRPTPVAGAVPDETSSGSDAGTMESTKAPAPKKSPRKKASTKKRADAAGAARPGGDTQTGDSSAGDTSSTSSPSTDDTGASMLFQAPTFDATPLFTAPDPAPATPAPKRSKPPKSSTDDATGTERTGDSTGADETGDERAADETGDERAADDAGNDDQDDGEASRRRRRRRGGRGRRRKPDDGDVSETDGAADDHGGGESSAESDDAAGEQSDDDSDGDSDGDGDGENGGNRRRRRRRRRKSESESDDSRSDDPPNTVVKVRDNLEGEGEVTSVKGSTRLEAKKQRRREGREAGRRRPPILTESEFLARREAVDRVMAVRQSGDLTQIGVLEDDVLVEHYVSRASQQSLIGNVYLGRVQNVLPAMEAAFIDIGRGRNAVLYAGEVDWASLGKGDGTKRIEGVLSSGQSVLVQVTKDPVGHKGARLTGQVSLPGRYVVYVPGGSMNGISRKLPDTERTRLKKILKQVVPEDAGVIVRTAAEGASEEELVNDVSRLRSQWEAIQKKSSSSAPALLHGEPDLAIKVVRDLFNEDFSKLVVAGDRAWDTIDEYVTNVASSLRDRVERWTKPDDVFAAYRIDEQITKAMDRKVWLPSGGSLIIDRTEAMTVVDVNTGKFTGSGGNLEETVTKNNLEAAEEIVRQLRLRDIGGIIVIDFIDMVLEANRDLVLRRLVECLGRDRTKHQVAEVTSLGLVQMTRKRIGTGLLEAFSEACPHCKGRGLMVHTHPVGSGSTSDSNGNGGSGGSGRSGRSEKRSRKRKSDQSDKQPDKQSDKSAKKSDEPVSPKLEASASPGEASPADLLPAGGANGDGDQTGGGHVDQTGGGSDSARIGDGGHGGAPDGEPAPAKKPASRSRRRAQRPAGRPETAGSSTAESGSSSDEPVDATAQS